MIKSNKAQSSIEIIIGIFFIILFIYIFNLLATDTVKTLEINKIKEQEQDITLSLSNFLYSSSNIVTEDKFNIIDYSSSYKVPTINIPSEKLQCDIFISEDTISISAYYNNTEINYIINNQVPSDSYVLPIATTCGRELVCENNANKIRCN